MLEGLIKAIELLVSGDPAVISITLRSIYVSGTATILASLWSIPLGVTLGIKSFRGRKVAKGVFNALLGIPTVALGLLLYLMFSRSGPLGVFQLLYTTTVITIGQAILITPILVSFTVSSVESVDPEISSLAKTLGASDIQASFAVLREAVSGVGLAAVASFNRAVAELGIALMLGGNIRGLTRVLTTSIALETGRGEIALGIALVIILLLVVFILSLAVNLISRGSSP
ncbi:MAG: ABC transporter permease subunit [Nitrososphaeria archaeon]|nr:ABC transporter permease subunit [Nitrososphaeria archaeon]NIN53621.1 ABC transporter permease subunit [Nitrososphaeria archaeon]NIQ34142.1 ABC transporter permease subunit [Nitrososphaeria archaeon]